MSEQRDGEAEFNAKSGLGAEAGPENGPDSGPDSAPGGGSAGEANGGLGGIALFIRRPILALVVNALIVIAGLAAWLGVEIRELPNVDRPVITVTTRFAGASAETVDQELTGRIEGAVGRVPGISSISSESRYGRSRVTLEFGDGVDLDVAATDTRDAMGRITADLPEGSDPPEIVKADANAQPVIRIAVTSASRPPQELTRIVADQVEDRFLSLPGVADLQIYGDRAAIFRVDIDMMALAARGLNLADIQRALANAGYDAPSGDLGGAAQSINVRTTATLVTPAAFEALEIAPYVRLGDIARVSLGAEPNATVLRANGQTGLGMGVIRQATANTLEISAAVHGVVAELQQSLPDDIRIFTTSDDAVFINGAITEVIKTLVMAVAIVVAVIFVFLRDARATLIPALTLPVALVGTLAAIWLAGFSVNILTLLALVLATGMVVDDAIVVLENIVRQRAAGVGARAAAVIGTRQVFFAVVTTTATLAAVFVPLSFLPGQVGGLFREFGFTLAIAVVLSSVVALSLAPMVASRVLGAPRPGAKGPMIWLGARLAGAYAASLRAVMAAPLVTVTVALAIALTALLMAGGLRQELTPREDRAVVLMRVGAPQGVSLAHTMGKMNEIEQSIAPLRQSGEVRDVFSITGFGADNVGFMVMRLATWEERGRSQSEIVAELRQGLSDVIGVRAFVIQPNSLGIRGAGRGLSFAVTGDDYGQLAEVGQALVARMSEDARFGRVSLDYETTLPQLFVEIDRLRAADLGIDITGLGAALQAVLDGRAVGEVFLGDEAVEVQMLSTTDPVDDPGDLENVFVRAGDGQMVPMASFVTLTERAVAPELTREGKERAVEISASLGPDMPLGAAMAEVERLGEGLLAPQNGLLPLAEAATLDETSAGLALTFGFAVLVVLLVLAAQFESFIAALVVMATVPVGLACAAFALAVSGQSLNVYSQIGLVMLVGIMAKNGILIVEFAGQLRDEGRSPREAAYEAATIRLRPVMMTMVSTVLGGLPLILSSGAGAEAREALGWVIVGGLGLATLSTLYLTPVAYQLLAGFSKPRAEAEARLMREMAEAGS